MKTITRLAAPALAIVAGLAAVAPAQAHETGARHYDQAQHFPDHRVSAGNIRSDIALLKRDIDRAERRGYLSHREAARLDNQVHRLERNFALSARNGLTRYELASLNREVRSVQFALRAEMNDRNARRG